MQKRFRRVFTALKEHGCVSYAKIATASGFCDVDLIIIKATSPDDFPLPDRYVHELLKIFSISPSSFRAFSLSFTRRFGKTQCWRVALKCLLLIHRLLRLVPESSPFRSELLWTRTNGLLSLYPCHFRDSSSSASENYTTFIRSYAKLLDEALDCFAFDNNMIITGNDQKFEEISLSDQMKEVGRLLEVLPQLQSLIDRVMDCRPTGSAAKSFIVRSTMKHIIRDSFVCYTIFRSEIVVVLENLFQMPYRSCISAFGIYKKAALQANQLCEFYDWCKANGLCGAYEYPFIDKIPQIQIRALETFLNGMWQLTESSSSSPSSLVGSPSSYTEDDRDGKGPPRAAGMDIVVSTEWEKFEETGLVMKTEEDVEREPLIQLESDDKVAPMSSWEAILEASVRFTSKDNLVFYSNGYGYLYGNGYGYGIENEMKERNEQERAGWAMQVYNPYNPFHQPYNNYYMPNQNGFSGSNPAYPWGL